MGFTWFNQVILGYTEIHSFFITLTGFFLVLLDHIWLYWVLLGFTRF